MGSPKGSSPDRNLSTSGNRIFRLSPSDLTFLCEECKRCFYLKVARGFQRPRGPFPKIFGVIDAQMKACFEGARTDAVAPGIPSGTVSQGEDWVESKPLALPGKDSRCVIRGKFDTIVHFDDGSYGVIDYKTAERKPQQIPFYSRQLHAYAYALEHPARGSLGLAPISKLGLVVFEPSAFSRNGGCSIALDGGISWLEIPRDEKMFLRFIGQVLSVLEKPDPPKAAPECDWCRYRRASRRTTL